MIKLIVDFNYGNSLERVFTTYNEAREYANQFTETTKQFVVLDRQNTWEDVSKRELTNVERMFSNDIESSYI